VTIEEKTFAVLSAASGITSLCPAARIKLPGDHQNLARPYIVHQPIAADPERVSGGRAALQRWVYQVSVFADTYSGARALAAAVVSAVDGTQGEATYFWRDQDHQFESDVRIHHIALGFEVFEAL
jgi:hypothetical protein